MGMGVHYSSACFHRFSAYEKLRIGLTKTFQRRSSRGDGKEYDGDENGASVVRERTGTSLLRVSHCKRCMLVCWLH